MPTICPWLKERRETAATEKAMVGPVRKADGEAPARQYVFALVWLADHSWKGPHEGHRTARSVIFFLPPPSSSRGQVYHFLGFTRTKFVLGTYVCFLQLKSITERCHNANIVPGKQSHSHLLSSLALELADSLSTLGSPQTAHTYHGHSIRSAIPARQSGAQSRKADFWP